MSLTIDASVWIAAADRNDVFHTESRDFLRAVVVRKITVSVPSFAVMEVACALARRLRDEARGRQMARSLMPRVITTEIEMDRYFLTQAESLGSRLFLRAADALYAAAAQETGGVLVSWDQEHVRRAGASTPSEWMVANP